MLRMYVSACCTLKPSIRYSPFEHPTSRVIGQPNRLKDVVLLDGGGEAHLGVCLGESDHGFELAGGGGDAAVGGADVLA